MPRAKNGEASTSKGAHRYDSDAEDTPENPFIHREYPVLATEAWPLNQLNIPRMIEHAQQEDKAHDLDNLVETAPLVRHWIPRLWNFSMSTWLLVFVVGAGLLEAAGLTLRCSFPSTLAPYFEGSGIEKLNSGTALDLLLVWPVFAVSLGVIWLRANPTLPTVSSLLVGSVSIGMAVFSRGMHISANAIHDAWGASPKTGPLYTAVYWWDENVSHAGWAAGLLIWGLAVCYREGRSARAGSIYLRRPLPIKGHEPAESQRKVYHESLIAVFLASAVYGALLAVLMIEGGAWVSQIPLLTVILPIVGGLYFLQVAFLGPRSAFEHYPAGLFVLFSYCFCLGYISYWKSLNNGSIPQFSSLDMIPYLQ